MSRGRKTSLWSISSYICLTLFLTVFLFLGLLNQSTYIGFKRRQRYNFPNFERLATFTKVLSDKDVSIDDSRNRAIVIGDIHGMNNSLHSILDRVAYNPEHDTLFFAGDLLAKSTHASSLSVLDFLTENHNVGGTQHIFAVRGNHDHIVVLWRAWREWFEGLTLPAPKAQSRAPFFFRHPADAVISLSRTLHTLFTAASDGTIMTYLARDDSHDPAVTNGREFLRLIEAEWALEKVENEPDPEEYSEVARKRSIGTWREEWWRRIPPPGKGKNAQLWNLFTDHYWLARDMTAKQAAYLTSLPLVHHVPHLHLFVAHAGLLPSDPRLAPTDPRQPLAHSPHTTPSERPIGYDPDHDVDHDEDREDASAFAWRLRLNAAPEDAETRIYDDTRGARALQSNLTVHDLRVMQETAILQEVPQNRDPWVVLNMRSVKKKGKVIRNGEKGTPWSEIWNDQMGRCDGFDGCSSSIADADEHDEVDTTAKKPKYNLQCHPATIVYGHAASRGLDIKRWSMGLDTGCLYGRKLTALVIRGPTGSQPSGDEDEDDDGDDDGDGDDEEDHDDDGNQHGDEQDKEDEDDEDVDFKPQRRKIRFGDRAARLDARLVSVRCPIIINDE